MTHPEHHLMAVEVITDRQVTRYTCPTCQRCLEDGPDGIALLFKGDQKALHRGGRLPGFGHEVEQDVEPDIEPEAAPHRRAVEVRTLH